MTPRAFIAVHQETLSGSWQRVYFCPVCGSCPGVVGCEQAAVLASATPSDTENNIFRGNDGDVPSPGAAMRLSIAGSTLSKSVSVDEIV